MDDPANPAYRPVRNETAHRSANGYVMTLVGALLIGLGGLVLFRHMAPVAVGVALGLAGIAVLLGLYMLQPNAMSARPRWFPICWWCCAPTTTRKR